MTELLKNLRAVRAQIATQDRWTKGTFSRDQRGNYTKPISRTATCWCLLGAIEAVEPVSAKNTWEITGALHNQLENLGDGFCLAIFNDDPATTHADIIALIDRAIASEERENA